MTRLRTALLLLALTALLLPHAPARAAEAKIVADVRVGGNLRLDRETILYYTTTKPGQPWDEERARGDFRKLWETGFFEDLRLEIEDTAEGIIVVWTLAERPMLGAVSWTGNEGVPEEDIRKALKDRGIEFREGTPFALGDIERARGLTEELVRVKGYRFAKVETNVSDDAEGAKVVQFVVDEGSKVKIEKIEFEGNLAFKDGALRDALKKTKEPGLLCFLNKKCVFNQANFEADLEHLRDFYYDRGYINFGVGEPILEAVGQGKKRRLHIRIPVTEGEMYSVGEIAIEGNSAYTRDTLLSLNLLQAGKPFSRKRMNESRTNMSEVYGLKGYFNVLIVPRFNPHEKENVVDVTYKITENELYYVNRISFKGNTTTKDNVIRRQMRIAEGDLFNTARFKRSLFRIYQLGYFKEPQPKIEPSAEDPTMLDVTIDLQEEGKNDIRIGGGVSGAEGFFATLSFSTRNLFGGGSSLSVDMQYGKRVKYGVLAYFDPYLWDRPISGGIDAFSRYAQYTDFERRGTGGQALVGHQLGDYWAIRGSYRYEDVNQEPRTRYDSDGNELPPDPILVALYTDQRKVSSLLPVLSFNSIDNPLRPWKGFRQVLQFEYSGGFLGGTTDLYKPRVDTTAFIPLGSRVNFGLHGEWSIVEGHGDTPVPLFERFYLGGEQSVRGFPTYSISPVTQDSFGNDVLLGGDKMLQANAELQFRIASPLSLVLFADAGKVVAEGQQLSLTELKTSFGGEVRFWTPFLQAPLRLIYAYIPEPLVRNGEKDPHTDFTFSIGTTF